MGTDRIAGQPAPAQTLVSANSPVYGATTEPVSWLTLDVGATRVPRSGEGKKSDELWLGDAFDPTRPDAPSVAVYVRIGQADALVAELVCGCAARLLGLPAPEAFVIRIPPGTLPKSSLASMKIETLCAGSRNIGGKTFSQLLSEEEDAAMALIHQWPELLRVATFDEWTANPDRNIGNLIYVAQTLHIIDHAESFGGVSRQIFPLVELTELEFDNKMGRLLSVFKAGRKRQLLDQAREWLTFEVGSLDLADLVVQVSTSWWHSSDRQRELIDFLQQRLLITHRLLCHRLGHPQLALTKNS